MAKNKSYQKLGPSQRQLKVGEVIRRTLSEILARDEIHDAELNRISITVSEVTTSPDLQIATVYVMPLGGNLYDETIAALARNKGQMRSIVGRRAGLKFAPDLRFRIDETFDRIDSTRLLFDREEVRRDLDAAPEQEPNSTPNID
ncbi:MAG: 30S ribosome-binding factor RbfA [Planktomarina sp.]|jgi:ribosome-binding factor A|nr:30S ribosome-binding factor RbfA [Planktomarina sp.]MDT2056956.1 30S ribosome-binding factor RbfA [Planktomarina sp.]MDT2072083.1 30S ribosome-binding factor RbfA [Planktomarina sp.]MDT2077084.1 30S ribosome-binding factor RbfA [Planktomarina sp.]|tara:strand:- start:237 stop:671 length:435 start_codon:yes stop_codon:yes gene_type:complete